MATGCRQPGNPNAPLLPIAPLGGQTRVPPPATGSFAVPNQYYQGQASLADSTVDHLAVADRPQPTASEPAVSVANSAMAAWTESSPRYTTAVQPASYASEPSDEGTELRPPLRGMQVVDLTKGGQLKPINEVDLQPIAAPQTERLPQTAQAPLQTATEIQPQSSPSTSIKPTTSTNSLNWRKPY